MALDRDVVDLRDVDGAAARTRLLAVDGARGARARDRGAAADEARDARVKPRGGKELERGEHAAIDQARLDVPAAAAVDRDMRVLEDPVLELLLAHQQDLPDRRV